MPSEHFSPIDNLNNYCLIVIFQNTVNVNDEVSLERTNVRWRSLAKYFWTNFNYFDVKQALL